MRTYIRFERGRDGIIGPTFGPYDFLQVTYGVLRTSPDGEDLATFTEDIGDWYIVDGKEHNGEFYSDFIVYAADKPE